MDVENTMTVTPRKHHELCSLGALTEHTCQALVGANRIAPDAENSWGSTEFDTTVASSGHSCTVSSLLRRVRPRLGPITLVFRTVLLLFQRWRERLFSLLCPRKITPFPFLRVTLTSTNNPHIIRTARLSHCRCAKPYFCLVRSVAPLPENAHTYSKKNVLRRQYLLC